MQTFRFIHSRFVTAQTRGWKTAKGNFKIPCPIMPGYSRKHFWKAPGFVISVSIIACTGFWFFQPWRKYPTRFLCRICADEYYSM